MDEARPVRPPVPPAVLLRDVRARRAPGVRLIIALDGRCASGKTTLAGYLQRRFGWGVIHMDHFFLRPEQRTAQRYETPGENVDHERFLEQVLKPLRAGEPFSYRPFDCAAGRLAPPVRVAPGAVTLVEGSYSCHPALWGYYDLHAFLTVGPEEQERRIEARNGPEGAKAFRSKWIPLEERYFAAYSVEERCEYRLDASREAPLDGFGPA